MMKVPSDPPALINPTLTLVHLVLSWGGRGAHGRRSYVPAPNFKVVRSQRLERSHWNLTGPGPRVLETELLKQSDSLLRLKFSRFIVKHSSSLQL